MSELDDLAFDFFRVFARCEYCLKAVGFRKLGKDAEADWRAFSDEVRAMIEDPKSEELKAAIEYILKNPPKKQVIRERVLAWDSAPPNSNSKSELVLRLVCRVRNNLFHGGKFNGRWFEPERSEALIKASLLILEESIRCSARVQEAYQGVAH